MKNRIIRSSTKKKILLLLLTGVALGLAYSSRTQQRILRNLVWQWKKINREKLYRDITDLEKHKYIRYRKKSEWWDIELTEKGIKEARKIKLDKIKIKKQKKWDGKWRMVLFDIPEVKRVGRDALRQKIKKLGFVELQKSVFINPYPCKKEIDTVIKFFRVEKFVQQCVVTKLNNSSNKKLKRKFKL